MDELLLAKNSQWKSTSSRKADEVRWESREVCSEGVEGKDGKKKLVRRRVKAD